jgi:hypothetical protein
VEHGHKQPVSAVLSPSKACTALGGHVASTTAQKLTACPWIQTSHVFLKPQPSQSAYAPPFLRTPCASPQASCPPCTPHLRCCHLRTMASLLSDRCASGFRGSHAEQRDLSLFTKLYSRHSVRTTADKLTIACWDAPSRILEGCRCILTARCHVRGALDPVSPRSQEVEAVAATHQTPPELVSPCQDRRRTSACQEPARRLCADDSGCHTNHQNPQGGSPLRLDVGEGMAQGVMQSPQGFDPMRLQRAGLPVWRFGDKQARG